jgi:hypothetical protein
MNIQTIVNDLLKSGLTQYELAEKLTQMGEPTNQSTINRIATNSDYHPKSPKVFALLSLHSEIETTKAKPTAA